MSTRHVRVRLVLEVVRLALYTFGFVSLGLWGFLGFALPWPGVLCGVLAPLLGVLGWALFLSPRAVCGLDAFGRALVEIALFTAVATAWWWLDVPGVAVPFAVVSVAVGVVTGRAGLRDR